MKIHGPTLRLSQVISEHLDGYPYLKTGLKEGIINYSALARKLIPDIEKQLGKKVHLESVMVAIKRYADKENLVKMETPLNEHVQQMSVTLGDSMTFIVVESDSETTAIVYNLFKEISWNAAEFRFILGSPLQKTILLKKARLATLIDKLPKSKIKKIEEGLSIITIRLPSEAFQNYNLITAFSSEFSKAGIPYMLFAAPKEIHFVVKDEVAQRGYSAIKGFSTKIAEPIQAR